MKWKSPVPGLGRSSPVLLGERIWLTAALTTNVCTFAAGPDRMQQAERVVIGVVCQDRATGKQLYHTELFPVDSPPAINFLNRYAEGRIHCVSREGKTTVLRPDRELTVLAETSEAPHAPN